jgi:hypothetical protein
LPTYSLEIPQHRLQSLLYPFLGLLVINSVPDRFRHPSPSLFVVRGPSLYSDVRREFRSHGKKYLSWVWFSGVEFVGQGSTLKRANEICRDRFEGDGSKRHFVRSISDGGMISES